MYVVKYFFFPISLSNVFRKKTKNLFCFFFSIWYRDWFEIIWFQIETLINQSIDRSIRVQRSDHYNNGEEFDVCCYFFHWLNFCNSKPHSSFLWIQLVFVCVSFGSHVLYIYNETWLGFHFNIDISLLRLIEFMCVRVCILAERENIFENRVIQKKNLMTIVWFQSS